MSPAVMATVSVPPAWAGRSGAAHSRRATAPAQSVRATNRNNALARGKGVSSRTELQQGCRTRRPKAARPRIRKIHTSAQFLFRLRQLASRGEADAAGKGPSFARGAGKGRSTRSPACPFIEQIRYRGASVGLSRLAGELTD